MRGFKYILLTVLFLGWVSPEVTGRVFQLRQASGGWLNVAGMPWDFVYHTTMMVNGRKNEVYLYSARFNVPVLEQLKGQFEAQGAKATFRRTPDGIAGMAKWDGGAARVLVLSPASQPNQMIFLFYPEAGAAGKTNLPIPGYPGGRVGNTVLCKDSNTVCSTVETADSAAQVHAFYAAELAARGWTPVVPENRNSDFAEGMVSYQKNRRICCIMAVERPGKLNRVTLLVKDNGL